MLALTYVVKENLPKDVLGLIADTYGFINYVAKLADKLDPDEAAYFKADLQAIKEEVDKIVENVMIYKHPELLYGSLVQIQAELEVLLQTLLKRLRVIGVER